MSIDNKERIRTLLKGIETGDAAAAAVVNEAKYIQHNPQTHEGSEGLAALFKRLAQTSPRVNVVRIFEDADFIFAHTEYDFAQRNIGFEIFRFENDHAVEHWDNIQQRKGPNSEGYSMVDGSTELADLEHTERNREVIARFVDDVLCKQTTSNLEQFINPAEFIEHNPDSSQRLLGIGTQQDTGIHYRHCHRLLAEGNFALAVSECVIDQVPTSVFDLFRLSDGKIVEHWDTIEAIPPQSEWKNDNGKF